MTDRNKACALDSGAPLPHLLEQVRACTLCQAHLPLGCRPVVVAEASARLLIIGQAPGTKVHASGIPWDDASGKRLRQWLAMGEAEFYDPSLVAIMPMGFCYPGRGTSGDLPPRPECAHQWHDSIRQRLPNIQTTLLIGSYAQNYYLPGTAKTLTERVQAWRDYAPEFFPLVHPSPRNQRWLKKNPWFEAEVVLELQAHVAQVLGRKYGRS